MSSLELITNFFMFLASVLLISFSGVLMPGPLLAVTLKQAEKSKYSGALIAFGHGIVEVPLILLIFFLLSNFEIPLYVQAAIGLIGGSLMVFMGVQTFRGRNESSNSPAAVKKDSLFAGIYTTAANAGFILWWLTIGTALILNAKIFGLIGFLIFIGVHWLCDFSWYSVTSFLIFKSQRFWSQKTRVGILIFCVFTFIGFGAYFILSGLWSLLV